MILPTTYLACLLALIGSLFAFSIWTLFHKLTFKWRWELYYYDVTWGLLIGSLVAAYSLGSMNSQELTFQDNLILAAYRKMAWAIVAGGVFNLGNILLMASTVVGRISLAFPAALGTALIASSAWESVFGVRGNLVLGLGGVVVLVAAIALHVLAAFAAADSVEMAKAAEMTDPRVKKPKPPSTKPALALILGVVSGLLFVVQSQMLAESQKDENGLAAYGAVLLFSFGIFFSTAIYVPFMANFPVQGSAVPLRQYFKGAQKNHIWGVLAGLVLLGGLLGQRVAAGAPAAAQVTPLTAFLISAGVAPLGALIGIITGDFKGSTGRGMTFALSGIVLFLVGAGLLGFSRFPG